MNDVALTFTFISIGLLCLNMSIILKLNEHKSNKNTKIKQIKKVTSKPLFFKLSWLKFFFHLTCLYDD